MRNSKFGESQTAEILKEVEAGVAVTDIAREHGISVATFSGARSTTG